MRWVCIWFSQVYIWQIARLGKKQSGLTHNAAPSHPEHERQDGEQEVVEGGGALSGAERKWFSQDLFMRIDVSLRGNKAGLRMNSDLPNPCFSP